ncbi:hypothetical protein [Spirosoma pomorum]
MYKYLRLFTIGFSCLVLLIGSSGVATSRSLDNDAPKVAQLDHLAVSSLVVAPAHDTAHQVPAPTVAIAAPITSSLFTLTQLRQIIRFQQQKAAYLSINTGPSVWDLSRGKAQSHRPRFISSKPTSTYQPPRLE